MRKFYFIPLFIFLCLLVRGNLGFTVLADDNPAKTNDIFSGVAKKTRLKITLKNGNFLTGEVKAIRPEQLILDISYEDTLAKGTIGVVRTEITAIEVLESFDEDRKRKILDEKEQQMKEYWKQAELERLRAIKETEITSTEASEPSGPRSEPEKSPAKTEIDDTALLKRFPPESGWGEKKYQELTQKDAWKFTPLETEFLENYARWKGALDSEAKKKRRAWLEKFPPGEQWNKEKYEQLSLQFIQRGVSPAPLEEEFINNFKDWQKALEERQEEEAKKEKEKTASPPQVSPETTRPQPPEETPPAEAVEEKKE